MISFEVNFQIINCINLMNEFNLLQDCCRRYLQSLPSLWAAGVSLCHIWQKGPSSNILKVNHKYVNYTFRAIIDPNSAHSYLISRAKAKWKCLHQDVCYCSSKKWNMASPVFILCLIQKLPISPELFLPLRFSPPFEIGLLTKGSL